MSLDASSCRPLATPNDSEKDFDRLDTFLKLLNLFELKQELEQPISPITSLSDLCQKTDSTLLVLEVAFAKVSDSCSHWTIFFADFFFFFTYNPDSIFNLSFGKFIIPLVFLLIGYSLYFLIRQAPRKIWLFILSLVLVNTTGVIIPDLISGGYASIMSRYFIPCYLGIEIAVAYLLASKINSTSITITQQRLWKAIAVSTITAGVISCTISSQSEFWWNKRTSSYDYLQASRIINQQNKPLLIAEKMFATLPLTHTLNSTTDLLVANTAADIEIPRYYDRIYLLQPSKQLKYKLEQQGYKLNIAYKGRKQSLWQLEKS